MLKKDNLSLLYSYILKNRIDLENYVSELQNNIRFKHVSVADCVELICAKQRLETFIEVTDHIRLLLEM